MKRSTASVDGHISSLEDGVRHDVSVLDGLISAAFAGESRVLWEGKFWGGTDQQIIGYGDLPSRGPSDAQADWFKVGLAVQKNHISVYVNAVEDGEYLTRQYEGRLGRARMGAASIGFKSIDDIDLQVFEELIERARALMT